MKHPSSKCLFCVLLLMIMTAMMAAGCAVPKDRALYRISSFRYPSFGDDMRYDGLAHCIRQSIDYLQRVPSDRQYRFGSDSYSAAHMTQSLELFLAFIQNRPSEEELRNFIKDNFLVYRSIGKGWKKEVLFTGYYEPSLKGSIKKHDNYEIPVLARPDDLIKVDLSPFSDKYKGETITGRLSGKTLVPYYDRKEIEQDNALAETAPVLAWVEETIDLFFLQIQGSGRIFLDNGTVINVHYDTHNGRPYRAIGRLLIDEGKIPESEMSMQKIRSFLDEHPEEAQDILNYNPSYVFFKIEEDGPLGALEVKLTPGRSIAIDRKIFPLPALAFIETEKPLIDGAGDIIRWEKFSRFVLSQDTGGAIRGPARSDLFWGNGMYAEVAAGHMQHRGNLYLLVLKPEKGSQD